MKKLLALLAAVLLGMSAAHAQRSFQQGELDALLAPIALQPDPVLSQLLMAATYPADVAAAARWSRANPQLKGEDAVRAVAGEPWDPSVKSLVSFPELLARMDESPQWLRDLGDAFLAQEAQVMDTVQDLRRRAQATGQLATTEQTAVYSQGEAIVIQPRTHIVYASYYDPYVVYGPWWWPHYRPVYWHPWAPRAAFVSYGVFYSAPDWHHRHVRVVHRPTYVHVHQHVAPGRWQHPQHSRSVHAAPLSRPPVKAPERQHVNKPPERQQASKPPERQQPHKPSEGQRRPTVQHAPAPLSSPIQARPPQVQSLPSQAREQPRQPMPAASGFTQRREHQSEHRSETRREQHRFESNHNQRGRESRGGGGREQRGQRG